jgi:sugar lactone lactonase YvrE
MGILLRRNTKAYLEANPPVSGEIVFATDTEEYGAIENGTIVWRKHSTFTQNDTDALYEPKDSTILKEADIGVNVQPYDSTILKEADLLNNTNIYTKPQVGSILTSTNDINFDLSNNFKINATAGTITSIGGTPGQTGTIVIYNADNITSFGARFYFKNTPTFSETETFSYFIESSTIIRIGVLR